MSTGTSSYNPILPPAGMSPADLAKYGYGSGTVLANLQAMAPSMYEFMEEQRKLQSKLAGEGLDTAVSSGNAAEVSGIAGAGSEIVSGGTSAYAGVKGFDMMSEMKQLSSDFETKIGDVENEIKLLENPNRLRFNQERPHGLEDPEHGFDIELEDMNDPMADPALKDQLVRKKADLKTQFENSREELKMKHESHRAMSQAVNGFAGAAAKTGDASAQKNRMIFEGQQGLLNQNASSAQNTLDATRQAFDGMIQIGGQVMGVFVALTR